jgi:hypothetical protein
VLTTPRVAFPLRFLLVVLFGLLVVFQVLSLPGQFAHLAEESPDLAPLRWPLTAVSVFCVLCAQVVVVATWKLLTLVERDRIFSEGASPWVDAIVWAIAAAWVALLGGVASTWDDPGLPLLLLLLLAGVAALGLLVVVMRALLRQATTLRTDMDAVI